MIRYQTDLEGVHPGRLHDGFFDGWWNAPNPSTHVRILAGSDLVVLAIDDSVGDGAVVGFVTALTDGVLYGEVTLLEVVPAYKGRGIGRELVERLAALIGPLYRIDIACSSDVLEFYAKLNFNRVEDGFLVSRCDRTMQSGRAVDGSAAPSLKRSGRNGHRTTM